MAGVELVIFGNAIKRETCPEELRFIHFQRHLFRLSPLVNKPYPTTVTSIEKRKNRPSEPLNNSSKKKEDRLRDLLTTPVDVKKRKPATAQSKRLARMSSRNVTLSEHQVRSRKNLSNKPKIPPHLETGAFDVRDMIPYLAKAYDNLYGQHLNSLKLISTPTESFDKSTPVESSRPMLEVRGIVHFYLSRVGSQDFVE